MEREWLDADEVGYYRDTTYDDYVHKDEVKSNNREAQYLLNALMRQLYGMEEFDAQRVDCYVEDLCACLGVKFPYYKILSVTARKPVPEQLKKYQEFKQKIAEGVL
jgi:hypothetical protein